MKKYYFLTLIPAIVFFSCESKTSKSNQERIQEIASNNALLEKAKIYFQALPDQAVNPDNPITPEKVALGKILFHDTRFSLKGNNSCNSCHNLATYGVDNLPTSKGDNGGFGDRNSPTVYNAAFHFTQFWDGRAKDVEEQAGGPILNPKEMAMPTKDALIKKMKTVAGYPPLFAAAFPGEKDAVTFDNVQKAIGAFERTLVTQAPFDKFLKGDMNALTADQKKGLESFIDIGCTTCHISASVGGTMFQKFGITADYRTFTHSTLPDEGRKAVTKLDSDKDIYKVCGLRNVNKTAPYFHDGSVADIESAIKIMAKAELGKDLTDAEIQSIKSFFDALTGEIPADALIVPAMP